METLMFIVITVVVSLAITVASIKLGISQKLWRWINKRMDPKYNMVMWIIGGIVLQVTGVILFKNIGLIETSTEPLVGIFLGINIGFMPIYAMDKAKK